MKKFFDRYPVWFAVIWIIVYVLAFGNADTLSESLGVPKLITVIVGLVLTVALLLFLRKHSLFPYCGLQKVQGGRWAWFLPLIAVSTVNFWHGMTFREGAALYLISMVWVAILEELIFRGLLFRAMEKDGRTAAVIVSSVTFGVGHIVNLLLGAELLSTALQLVEATALGFCFTAIFMVTGSLLPCILSHAFINCTSFFALDPTPTGRIVTCIIVTVVAVSYGAWLLKKNVVLYFEMNDNDEE
ncbi:MAG: CPBP family intramembrane metalloprotease [Oscillospiraceae bacterium]|nr:CPBP family intramembrane metalloprotease [Oscillospiraceae bacterium]